MALKNRSTATVPQDTPQPQTRFPVNNSPIPPQTLDHATKSSVTAIGVFVFLALIVVVGINFIPYLQLASILIGRIPGMVGFLRGISVVAFLLATIALCLSSYWLTYGVADASKKMSYRQSRRIALVLAGITAVICASVQVPPEAIFAAALGAVVSALIILNQFRWILFQNDFQKVLDSGREEVRRQKEREELQVDSRSDLKDDLEVASRSRRQTLKRQATIALIIDICVSVYTFPPIAINSVWLLIVTQNLALIDWFNAGICVVTTLFTGWLLRLYLSKEAA
ncbi:hypothetical protein H6F43_03200 [Leptolyngbya sp. FACHB-36]|uniref:hypothetical protein n=1 Tax=Leptolyngbya sp. FACHB-36 TaxID=2692808 RepID=UPI00168196ED|nr:hypothetical protein [Leptolyngbya sp. FACHB-36]MBD2019190.1 hypothetical protein [Leptolyngbya sp. FACHB-36]